MAWDWRLVVVAMLVGCGNAADDDAASSTHAASAVLPDEPMPRDQIPEPQAFLGWTDNASLVEAPKPKDAQHIEVACADKHLYPTHPAATRKRYHRASYGRYDHFKLSGDSAVCKTPGNTKDPSTGQLRCLAPDSINYIVLSDTFEDGCGHFYRGFWAVSFLGADENMGTLMSLGRTFYDVPNAEFKGDVYDAQTRAVDPSEILFASPLQDGDAAAIAKGRKDVIDAKTHRYNPTTHVWEYIGPNR